MIAAGMVTISAAGMVREALYNPTFMWRHHLWNLCGRSWAELLARLSTSTLAVVIFSVAIPVVTFACFLTYALVHARRSGGDVREVFRTAVIPTSIATGITVLFWLCLFGWSVGAAIYRDHQDLVSYIPKARLKQASSDQVIIGSQAQEMGRLRKLVPALSPKCWVQNFSLPPPRAVPRASSAGEAVLFCDVEIKPPKTIVLDYDQQLIGTGMTESNRFWGFENVGDKQISLNLNSRTIGPYEAFVVVVYGGSNNSPRVQRYEIR